MKPAWLIPVEQWWSAHRRALSVWIPAASLALFLLTTSFFLITSQVSMLFRNGDAGYGDTYILYDVIHYQRTGEIYRDLSLPPYLPAQYSPLVYMMYAIPKLNASGNPYFGPRLMAIAAFLLCVGITISIVRALIPDRYAWCWGLLFSTSIPQMASWVLQLRGDFPAIFCDLAGIRLLLAKPRYALLLAGLFAGFATQFKFVYVSTLLAGSIWLLFQRRFKDLGLFVAGALVTSVGLYFLLSLREPRMLAQMFALSPGIPEYPGMVKNLVATLETPIIVFALPALPYLVSRRSASWMLLLLLIVISFSIATATGIQAGANINYYFEGLFALVPLATVGTLQLLEWSRGNVGLAIFVASLVLTQFLMRTPSGNQTARSELFHSVSNVRSRNDTLRKLSLVLQGEKILSVLPDLSLLDSQPALVEPFLAAYERRIGKFNIQPLLNRVNESEFDVAITPKNEQEPYRGIPHIDPLLQGAIAAKYAPYCTILEGTLHFPRDRQPDPALLENLRGIGCKPVDAH